MELFRAAVDVSLPSGLEVETRLERCEGFDSGAEGLLRFDNDCDESEVARRSRVESIERVEDVGRACVNAEP